MSKIEVRKRTRHGVALILVLILVVMISLGAYTFTDMMIAEERATVMSGRQMQAQAGVASGVEYLKDYLTYAPEDQIAIGGHWDNPSYFKDIPVSGDDPTGLRFAIVSVAQDQTGEPTGWRYGLEDEGSKININVLATSDLYEPEEEEFEEEGEGSDGEGEGGEGGGEQGGGGDQGGGGGGDQGGGPGGDQGGGGDQPNPAELQAVGGRGDDELATEAFDDPRLNVLMQLPLMTEQIADSIIDFIDEDDDPRPAGAEGDVYAGSTNYSPPNSRIGSLDELLLVDGVTTELLYGADRNHNGLIDEDEQAFVQPAGAEGSMARGWSAYLTVHSKDYLQQSEDPEPIDVNGDDLEALYDELIAAGIETDISNYIIAYRQGGAYEPPEPQEPQEGEEPQEPEEPPVAESISGRTPTFEGGDGEIGSVLDIIGSSTQTTFDGEDEEVLVASPLSEDSDLSGILPTLMSTLSVGETTGEGRINLNHCSSAAMSGLPCLDFTVAQNILLSQDPSQASGDLNYLYPTWPLARGAVSIDQMKALLPYVSGTGTVYRAQVIGYSDVPGVYARAEVVIDASGDAPTVLSWRDLTHLGPGFDPETFTTGGTP